MRARRFALPWLALLACTGDLAGGTPSGGAGAGSPDGGAPACPAPLASCGGACVDLAVDPAHCGACGAACAEGLACASGACAVACGASSTACDGRCVDTARDPAHCGACGQACASGSRCDGGACLPTCAEGEVACGASCAAVARDEAHCGACGVACPAGQPCVFGKCVAATLHHLLVTGQSLSVGALSAVVSATQPFDNVMFSTGVRAGASNLVAFAPLVEAWDGSQGETLSSGFANLLTSLTGGAGAGLRTLASAHGVGGQPYSALRKGTAPYAAGLAQVAAGAAIAAEQGLAHAVRAVAVVHGESDHVHGNERYTEDLLAWQSDYEADVQAATGQALPVPMCACQMSSFTKYGSATSSIPLQQLAAAEARPDRFFVVGPKYMLPYVADGVHLAGDGERWLGELYAKAWRRVLVDGERWRPLSPRAVERDGAVLRVRFWVPTPPLVIDTTTVTDPGDLGFRFTDSSASPPGIASVALEGEDTVRITLTAAPTGGNRRIHYAMFGAPGAPAGPATGARGNLRDSDATASLGGYALANWCVHFAADVP